MNKQLLGHELKIELEKGHDVRRISRWAFRIFSENIRLLDPSLTNELITLFSMEDDPQFELSFEELSKLADSWISEGEKEDLGDRDPKIKESVQILMDNWVMCPLCQEAWENVSDYPMLRCPKCRTKLHNTR